MKRPNSSEQIRNLLNRIASVESKCDLALDKANQASESMEWLQNGVKDHLSAFKSKLHSETYNQVAEYFRVQDRFHPLRSREIRLVVTLPSSPSGEIDVRVEEPDEE